MWLIQAYHKDRKDLHAIALCEQLVKSDIPQVKQWADKALDKLMATTDSVTSAPRPTAPPPPADTSPPINQSTPSLPVETPPTGQFTDAVNPLPKPAVARSTGSQSRSPKKSPPKDYTQQIMSAIAHGSISMLASFLIYLLFSDSVFANGLGLLRFGVPLLIFFHHPRQCGQGQCPRSAELLHHLSHPAHSARLRLSWAGCDFCGVAAPGSLARGRPWGISHRPVVLSSRGHGPVSDERRLRVSLP